MEFRILGPLEVISDGRALDLGGAKQRSLLAVLLIHPNEAVSRDTLIDALWEQSPPDAARKALQVHVARLRKQLGRDRIQTKAPGYAIRVAQGELDVEQFERLAAEGGRSRMSPTPASRARRSAGWRSAGWPCSRSGSRPTSRSAATRS